MKIRSHSIEVLFPAVLLLLFATLAIMVVMFSAKTYQHLVERSSKNYTTRTALNYVTQKVRQSDSEDSIETGSFDGQNALILHSDGYSTYLYAYHGKLCELYLVDGAEAKAASGTAVLDLSSFEVTWADDSLLHVVCTDTSSETSDTYISLQSSHSRGNS